MPKSAVTWSDELDEWTAAEIGNGSPQSGGAHVVCMDFGMKWNIPRHFASRGNRVTIVPGDKVYSSAATSGKGNSQALGE